MVRPLAQPNFWRWRKSHSGASVEFLSVRHDFRVVAGDSFILDDPGLLQASR